MSVKSALEKLPIFRRYQRDVSRESYERRRDERGFTDDGQLVDSTPMEPPIGYVKQPSMVEIIREQVRNARLQAELDEQGFETFEEADDFDVGDPDDLPKSIYEFERDFDPSLQKGTMQRIEESAPVSSPPAPEPEGPAEDPPADPAKP